MPMHFYKFLETRSRPGLVIVLQELDIGTAIDDLMLIWAATEAEEGRERIDFVPL